MPLLKASNPFPRLTISTGGVTVWFASTSARSSPSCSILALGRPRHPRTPLPPSCAAAA